MPRGRHLYLLFTPDLCRRSPWRTLRAAIAGGVDLVQWRVRPRDGDGAARCREMCALLGVPMIVNDDVALAVELDAAGAHVGQEDLEPRAARALLGPDRWLGVSTHDVAQVRAAAPVADYLGFGPMFATATKGYDTGQPPGALAAAVAATDLPVFAIGGIDRQRVARIVAEGCPRAAVCAAILGADDPERAAAELRAGLGHAG